LPPRIADLREGGDDAIDIPRELGDDTNPTGPGHAAEEALATRAGISLSVVGR